MVYPRRPRDTLDTDSGQWHAEKGLLRLAHFLQAVHAVRPQRCLYISLGTTSRPHL